jgi:hypothetical protein
VSLDVRGFSIAHPPRDVLREAHRRVLGHVAAGEIAVDVEPLALSEVETAWARQGSAHGGTKLVLLPGA